LPENIQTQNVHQNKKLTIRAAANKELETKNTLTCFSFFSGNTAQGIQPT